MDILEKIKRLSVPRPDTTPNGEEMDRGTLDRYIRSTDNRIGDCQVHALKKCYDYQKEGIEYKMCLGTYGGGRHRWTEYKDPKTGKWVVDDPAQGIKGWTREECKKYVCTLETKPDFRKGRS
jgi:hypothetical protein